MPFRLTYSRPYVLAFLLAFLLGSPWQPAQAQSSTTASLPPPELNAPTPTTTPSVPDAAMSANLLTAPAVQAYPGQTNIADVPFIQWILANNATATPLGDVGGLQGWLISNGHTQQTIYVTPDGKHAVIGILASVGGEDVTALQLTALTLGHAPVITKNDPSGRGRPDGVDVKTSGLSNPAPQPAPPVSASGTSEATANPVADALGNLATGKPDMEELAVTPTQMAKAIDNTAVFTVGAEGKPDMVMIADPNCPYCHASWNLLAPLVKDGKIDLTVILVDWLNGSKEKALDLLANPDIGNAWDQGQGSVEGIPVSRPQPGADMKTAAFYLAHNEAFAKAVDISGTPTVIWVARKDAKSQYKVFKGTGLAGVGGFLTAVQDSQVATMR